MSTYNSRGWWRLKMEDMLPIFVGQVYVGFLCYVVRSGHVYIAAAVVLSQKKKKNKYNQ